jgi:hypothetical protein
VVVDVSDDTAALLGGGWEPADKPEPKAAPKKATAPKPAEK